MKQLRGYNQNRENQIPDAVKDNPQFSNAMQKYGNLSEDALIGQLLEQIRAAQEQGTYNPAQMKQYVGMLSPYLSGAQREKLQNLVRVIERENG